MSWSDLPSELVIKIAGNLTEFTDHLRFRSVCSHWRSSFHSHSLCLPQQLPWLAFPSTSSTHFYCLSEDRVYPNPSPSVVDNSHLFGSASGWFLSVSVANTFSLINPFTGASIGLPSPDPSSSLFYVAPDTLVWDRSDSVVVAACSKLPGAFYCRLGEATWASIVFQQYRMVSSIIFYEGRFYILQVDTCETVILDGETLEQITVISAPRHWMARFLDGNRLEPYFEPHLFVSSGELLLLDKTTWMYRCGDCYLHFYMVRRANLNDQLVEWINVYDIGDRALFVDNLRCFSVKVGDNCLLKRNCIYSVQSKTSGGSRNSSRTYSISIFDVEDRSGEYLEGALSKFCAASLGGADSPPSWVLPSLN